MGRRSARDLSGNAGAVVGDLDHGAFAIGARCDSDRALLAERIDRVVEQVRPHLIELRSTNRELGQRAIVVAHKRDRCVLELVAENRQRRLKTFVQIDLHEAASIHIG